MGNADFSGDVFDGRSGSHKGSPLPSAAGKDRVRAELAVVILQEKSSAVNEESGIFRLLTAKNILYRCWAETERRMAQVEGKLFEQDLEKAGFPCRALISAQIRVKLV